jgi:hypothetical protein
LAGRRGKAQKAADDETIPLCLRCHRDFHSASGAFRAMNKAQRIEWQTAMVLKYRELFTRADRPESHDVF